MVTSIIWLHLIEVRVRSYVVTWTQFAALAAILTFTLQAAATVVRPVLYKVTSSKTQKVSYIFGSYHFGIGLEEFPTYLHRAIDSAEAIYVESRMLRRAELLTMTQTHPQQALDELLKLDGGRPVKGDFTEDELQQLVGLGIPRPFAEQMTDEHCTFLMFRREFFIGPLRFLEAEVQKRAEAAGKPVIELDSQELSERAYKDEPKSQCRVRDYLKDSLRQLRSDLGILSFRNWYKSLTPEYVMLMPGVTEPSVTIRTTEWMKALVPAMTQKSAFVSVGMDHLRGEQGLIQLLQNHGFTVRPLVSNEE